MVDETSKVLRYVRCIEFGDEAMRAERTARARLVLVTVWHMLMLFLCIDIVQTIHFAVARGEAMTAYGFWKNAATLAVITGCALYLARDWWRVARYAREAYLHEQSLQE